MLKAIGFGLAVGAGIQAWRNFPPDGPTSARPLALMFILGVVCAYLGGRWHGRHHVSAWASASATATAAAAARNEATQTVNLAVVVPGEGAGGGRHRAGGVSVPGESVPWLDGPRAAVTGDQLDGLDLSELIEESDQVP